MRNFFLLTIIATTSGFFFNTPNYIRFNTQYYNATNCSSIPFHNTSYENFCYDSANDCCNDILKETTYSDNRKLDVCYLETIDNNTIPFLYHCEETTLNKEQSLMLTFSLIGVIFLFLMFVLILSFISWWCFCKRSHRSAYDSIN